MSSSVELKAILEVGQGSDDLKAVFNVGQDLNELKAIFEARHDGSIGLKAIFEVGQDSASLFANFEVQHTGTPGSVFIKMRVMIHFSGKEQNLPASFILTRPAEELKAIFNVRQIQSVSLPARFIVIHTATRELYAKFDARYFFVEGWAAEKAIFTLQHEASVDEPKGILEVRASGSADLFGRFTVRHSAFAELLGLFIVRYSAGLDGPKALFEVRHGLTSGLTATFTVRHSASTIGPKGIFMVQHWRDLKIIITLRHSTSSMLSAKFYTRFPPRLWTNRRYINGVIDMKEIDMGDAILEYVIEGVMEDIQGMLEANSVSYSTWTDISLVPVLIRRAVTYGTVASLYARRSKTFRSRVIPSVAPVTVTVMGDEEAAMRHWETRRDDAINTYLTTINVDRILVSTADQEPVFSSDLEDIPPELTSETSWHEWVRQREG
jgi:hypothetical protein